MAPAQCPRQVLVWTLPAVAVLITFFWYKRRKNSLRSDPGGTITKKSSERFDTQNVVKNSCVNSTVDSDQVIAAIGKVIRDRETSQAIEEVVSFEEEEEEEIAVDTKRSVKLTSEVKNERCVKDCVRDIHSSIGSEFSVDSFRNTSTPLEADSTEDKTDITALDTSIICVVEDSNSATENNISNLSSDFDHSCELLSSNSVITVSSYETTLTSGNNTDGTIIDLTSDVSVEKSSVESIDNSVVKQSCDSKVLECQLDVVNSTEANNTCTTVNNKTASILYTARKNTSKKSNNKKNSVSTNNCSIKPESNDSKVKDNKIIKDNNKKALLNSDSNKTDKVRSNKKYLNGQKSNGEVCCGNTEEIDDYNKMELPCSRVEQLGHNSSSTTILTGSNNNNNNKNEAGLEQKLATLGLESSHNTAENGERDSANHSPAEVMLASPSIMSNFSDEHSEGSSDSGKGCSDIPDISTPPAGGSSVAGDLVPSVYEFIIPQYMVGRLIGRHGGFLHDIRSKTHTHIFIKRHPDTMKLKVCAIEGAQQDIDAALEMIRQKFPSRRFPNLTLEKVTFVNILPSHCPLQPDHFQLQLIEGVNNDVILSSLVTAGHFFLQQPMHPSYQSLCQLNMFMNTVYNSPEAPALETPLKDAICVAPAMGGWYRAQIIDVDEDNKTVDVRFLDYGGFLTLESSTLRKIRGDLMMLPFQAVECLLANVVPIGGEDAEWTEEARQFVQSITCGQILQANISEYTEQGIPLVFLYAMYCEQVVIVNQELIARGFAEAYSPPPLVTEE